MFKEDKIICKHWDCPYKCCLWHEFYDKEAFIPIFWEQEIKNPATCIYYLDI